MTILSDQAAKILYRALEAETGLILHVYGAGAATLRAQQILYRFRKELGDPELKRLQFRLSPRDPDHELWIIKEDSSP